MDLKKRAKQLKADIPAVFIALRKKETPLLPKVLAGVTIAYALSPIDLIPDFIPVIGYLDDIILLPLLVALTIRLIPEEVFARCRKEAEGLWADGLPVNWRYAVPIVVCWLLIILAAVKAIKN